MQRENFKRQTTPSYATLVGVICPSGGRFRANSNAQNSVIIICFESLSQSVPTGVMFGWATTRFNPFGRVQLIVARELHVGSAVPQRGLPEILRVRLKPAAERFFTFDPISCRRFTS